MFRGIGKIKSTLQGRLFLAFMLLLLIPTVILETLLFVLSIRQLSKAQVQESAAANTQTSARAIDSHLNRISAIANLIGQDPYIQAILRSADALEVRAKQLELELAKYRPGFSDVSIAPFFIFPEGKSLHHQKVQDIDLKAWQSSTTYKRLAVRPFQAIWSSEAALHELFVPEEKGVFLVKPIHSNEKDAPAIQLLIFLPRSTLAKNLYSAVESYQSLLLLDNEDQVFLSIDNMDLLLQDIPIKQYTALGSGRQEVLIQSKDYFLNYTTIPSSHWTLLFFTSPAKLYKPIYKYYYVYSLLVFVLALLLLILVHFTIRRTLSPLRALSDSMHQVILGDLSTRVDIHTQDEVAFLSEQYNLMLDSLQELVMTIYNEQEEKRQTEMALLQNQINPHFLYNTLAAVRYLNMNEQKKEVDQIILSLTIILRNTLSDQNNMVTIGEEIDLLKQYLEIQKIMLGKSFVYELIAPAKLAEALIPKFVLQPIVENSFIHGFRTKNGLCRLRVRIRHADPYLKIRIVDNGVGSDRQNLINIQEGQNPFIRHHIGLRNIKRRLSLIYGNKYSLSFWSRPGLGTLVELSLPMRFPAPLITERSVEL